MKGSKNETTINRMDSSNRFRINSWRNVRLWSLNMNNYYEAPYDDCAGQEEFENEITQMLKEERYDPTTASNMSEALAQASNVDQALVQEYTQNKDWAKLGLKLSVISYEYWYDVAEFVLTH